ncbi:hypothetical protein CLOAM1260 [Candidatus Cloacimonas acidaminovorans str. Evry]|uniref:Uncharacterized protein n=1 Tax=Cloacimonas acidaminovorans (strain Evry) TaxID=459349 RepID=B0VIH9_CLOAI|nr:hypothetical protein CLOAM1260 [Candidatus Cloacimonas acidaminovorans str. Evry]
MDVSGNNSVYPLFCPLTAKISGKGNVELEVECGEDVTFSTSSLL